MTIHEEFMAKLKRSFGYKKAVVAYLRERQMINGKLFCALCNEPLSRNKTTIDHIIPLAKGGEERLENYQLVHRRCNELKGDNYGFTIDKTIDDNATIERIRAALIEGEKSGDAEPFDIELFRKEMKAKHI